MSSFQVKNKVAIVTGGASGIGLEYVKVLLKNGARAVTFADINETVGKQTLKQLSIEFGTNKVLFVKADVCDKEQFEEIFKQTVSSFKNVDILINNAGILNDSTWEKEISININGTVHGILLGLEHYIPKYKTAEEGLIVNISSIAALHSTAFIPIYAGTKAAILGMSTSFGALVHYERTKVKVIAVCPGVTDTPLIQNMINALLGEEYKNIFVKGLDSNPNVLKSQTAEQLGKSMIKVIEKAQSGSVWVAECGDDPYEIEYINKENIKRINN